MNGGFFRLIKGRITPERYGGGGHFRWPLMSIAVGVVSGLGAILFEELLRRAPAFFPLSAHGLPGTLEEGSEVSTVAALASTHSWLFLIDSGAGGTGIRGYWFFSSLPEAEGSRHRCHDRGLPSPRRLYSQAGASWSKFVASALTIGSGGSAGKEGPIAQIGAGFGSFLATVLKLKPRDRRILVLAGAAGGIGAIFHAPLGGRAFRPGGPLPGNGIRIRSHSTLHRLRHRGLLHL